MPAKKYAELDAELQEIIVWFEGQAFDIDEAVKKYEQGLQLIKKMEEYLAGAENTITELKAKFSAES